MTLKKWHGDDDHKQFFFATIMWRTRLFSVHALCQIKNATKNSKFLSFALVLVMADKC